MSSNVGRRVLVAFAVMVAAWWLMYFLVAWWTPDQGEDWSRLAWLRYHAPVDLRDIAAFLRDHPNTGDALGLLAVACRPVYLLVTPTVIVLLVLGLHRLAFGRLPDPRSSRDLLRVALVHALIWTGAPRVGVTLGHRPHVIHFVYGLTALVWLVGSLRSGERARPPSRILAVVLGVLGGASNHHIAIASLAVLVFAIVRRRRSGVPAWLWMGAIGVVIGIALLFTSPQPYFAALGRRGFASTFGQVLFFLREGGETIALCTLTTFGLLVKSRWTAAAMPVPSAADLRWIAGCFFGGFALVIISLLGPRLGEPAMFAPSLLFVAGAAVALARLDDDVWVRRFFVAVVVAVHVIVAWFMLTTYARADRDASVRLDQLHAAAPDSVATITPYRDVEISFWFLGEDLGWAHTRELAAIEVFGLRDIAFDRETGVFEPASGLVLAATITTQPPAPPDELAHALGSRMGTNLGVARGQVGRAIGELRRHGYRLVDAAVEVVGLDFAGRNGRRIYAAKYGSRKVIPDGVWAQRDPMQRMSFRVDWDAFDGDYDEAHVIGEGRELPVSLGDDDRLRFIPEWGGAYTLVVCNARECFAVITAWVRY